MNRRDLLLAAGCALGGQAWAQTTLPPLRIVVPFPPGGFTDVVSRMVAERLQAALGRTVVVENKPGAGTNLAAESVAKGPADGNTVLMGTSSLAINPALYPKIGYSPQADLRPLGLFASTGYVLLANKSVPAGSTGELIALARSQPGRLTYGSSGNGAVNHLAGELFKSMSSTFIVHIPYRGSQAALTDLVGGRIDLYWSSLLEAQPLLAADRAKALALSNRRKVESMPAVPLIGDTLKGYEVEFWMGLFVPAATAPAATAAIEQALKTLSADAAFAAELTRRGAQVRHADPAAARGVLADETARWADVVRRSGAKID